MRDTVIIANPVAGSGKSGERAQQLADALRAKGEEARVIVTERAGHARDVVRALEPADERRIVVAGGDGTVMEIFSGLREAGLSTPVLQLPAGTANVLAGVVEFPRTIEAALGVLQTGHISEMDLGHAKSHDRYFAIAAGAGYDAAVMRGASRPLKNTLGFFAYLASAAQNLWQLERARVEVRVDGRRRIVKRAHTLLVANAGLEGGGIELPLGPRVSHDDGLLDLLLVESTSPGSLLHAAWCAIGRDFERAPGLTTVAARSFRIETFPALPVQIDGDVAGETPLEVEVVPRAARLLTGV